jgi:excinuclease ABC subunit C
LTFWKAEEGKYSLLSRQQLSPSFHLQPIIAALPDSPGVYQYFDKEGKILYVGKAKNLKKRVSSYFHKEHESGKLRMLVRRIDKINCILVKTEWDALLLENSLIKKHQPRYNVMLKDDKTYPWICIKNEPFPRVFSTRTFIRDGSTYFGPYASVRMMKMALDFAKRLYPTRTCNLNLTEENISKGKFKHCLEFDMGNCLAPCESRQSKEEYDRSIGQIKQILKGNLYGAIQEMQKEMKDYAEKMEYEKAHEVKERLEKLKRYQSKSEVVSPSIHDVDVFSILSDEKSGYVNFLKVLNGAIVQANTIELTKKLEESDEELLLMGIAELRQRMNSESKEVIIPFQTEAVIPNVTFVVPEKGDKKRLLELSENNLRYYVKEKKMLEGIRSPQKKTDEILEQMKKDLRLKELPRQIECFDNSNIQGAFPVAAMTVFKDAKPSKRDYRHFNIRTVVGPDDFASMEEVIYRRYKRALEENQPLPQLIVIDGGKGQLTSALNSLKALGLDKQIPVIGIAKRLEEIYFPDDSIPLYLDKRSPSLRIIQQIRDEAHRFGITHHRKRRGKATIKSSLSGIKGIGENTIQKLLTTFGSVERLKNTPEGEIEKVIGKDRTQKLLESLKNK